MTFTRTLTLYVSRRFAAMTVAMLVALAVALTGEFRRHGGGLRIAVGIGLVVGLLAFGLTGGNLAARNNIWVPLIWIQAVAPGLVALWWLAGAPGWPRADRPPVPAAP